jgi:hypothetical protein
MSQQVENDHLATLIQEAKLFLSKAVPQELSFVEVPDAE